MATKLDLADAQFIGYCNGKNQSLIHMVESMGLTKSEWKKWRKEYTSTYLSEKEVTEIDRHFNFKTR